MLVTKEFAALASASKDKKMCGNCSVFSMKLLQLEESLKGYEENLAKAQIELEHSKVIQEQQRLLFDKRVEDFRTASMKDGQEGMKDKEVSELKQEVRQRDQLLAKAKKLVSVLSEELAEKTREVKNLKQNNFEQVLQENEKLKEKIKDLENVKEAQKNDSFSFDTESFGSKVVKSHEKDYQKLENDLIFMSNQLDYTQTTLKNVCDENSRLKEILTNVESKLASSIQENLNFAEKVQNLEQILHESQKRQYQVENEMQELVRSNRSSLSKDDFSKLISQRESFFNELTSQMLRKTHRRHRHSSHVRDMYEFVEAVKTEVKSGKEPNSNLSKESLTIFKDFQCWYRTHKFDPKRKFLSEILLILLTNTKGKVKSHLETLANDFPDLEYEQIEEKLIKSLKIALIFKVEVLAKIKEMSAGLKLGIESIEIVCSKILELKLSVKEDDMEKIVDLALEFLKGFAKERVADYENSCEVMNMVL
jgi:hypothetical protein